jgi:hypothetical protein
MPNHALQISYDTPQSSLDPAFPRRSPRVHHTFSQEFADPIVRALLRTSRQLAQFCTTPESRDQDNHFES